MRLKRHSGPFRHPSAYVRAHAHASYADVCWRMRLTRHSEPLYADICWRMLMYAHATLVLKQALWTFAPLDRDDRIGLGELVQEEEEVSIRQYTSAYVRIRQHTIEPQGCRCRAQRRCYQPGGGWGGGPPVHWKRQHTSAYVSIRQHLSATWRRRRRRSPYTENVISTTLLMGGNLWLRHSCVRSSGAEVSERFDLHTPAYITAYVSIRQHTWAYASRRQHTSEWSLIRQHTLAYVSIRDSIRQHTWQHTWQHTTAYVTIRQHTSAYVTAYVSIRQDTSGYFSRREHTPAWSLIRQHMSAYVSIRQHTSAYVTAYVSIRQHTSAYVSIRQHTSAYVTAYVSIR
jgi:hypothetical protein